MLFFYTHKTEKFHVIFSKLLIWPNEKNLMKSLIAQKRFKAIFGITMIAIGISAISKKVISYPVEGCKKESQELTLNREWISTLSS